MLQNAITTGPMRLPSFDKPMNYFEPTVSGVSLLFKNSNKALGG
jgi:hypothetical protein